MGQSCRGTRRRISTWHWFAASELGRDTDNDSAELKFQWKVTCGYRGSWRTKRKKLLWFHVVMEICQIVIDRWSFEMNRSICLEKKRQKSTFLKMAAKSQANQLVSETKHHKSLINL